MDAKPLTPMATGLRDACLIQLKQPAALLAPAGLRNLVSLLADMQVVMANRIDQLTQEAKEANR